MRRKVEEGDEKDAVNKFVDKKSKRFIILSAEQALHENDALSHLPETANPTKLEGVIEIYFHTRTL